MPKLPKTKRGPIVEARKPKEVVCGHEEVTHPEKCHEGELQDCDLMYFRCGEHGEHYEKDCQKLCV